MIILIGWLARIRILLTTHRSETILTEAKNWSMAMGACRGQIPMLWFRPYLLTEKQLAVTYIWGNMIPFGPCMESNNSMGFHAWKQREIIVWNHMFPCMELHGIAHMALDRGSSSTF